MFRTATLVLLPLAALLGCSPATRFEGGQTMPDAQFLPDPQPAPAFTAAELRLLALHPGGPDVELIPASDGGVAGLVGRLGPADREAPTPAIAATTWAREFGVEAFGWSSPEQDLSVVTSDYAPVPVSRTTDQGVARLWAVGLVQLHRGVPLDERRAVVLVATHELEDGLVPAGYFGELGPELTGHDEPTPEPALTAEQALLGVVGDRELSAFPLRTPSGALAPHRGQLQYTEGDGGLRLVWRILVLADEMQARLQLRVDANTGALLDWFNDLPSDWTTASAVAWRPPSPRTVPAWEGVEPLGAHQYTLQRPLSAAGGVLSVYDPKDPFSTGFGVQRSTPDFSDARYTAIRYATDAYEHVAGIAKFYEQNYSWPSWDGHGASMILYADYVSAKAGSSWNAYGGGGMIKLPSGTTATLVHPSAVSRSVMAHEYFHNVTEAANPLEYFYESGALNEAFSDLSGQLVRKWSSDWVADECTASGGDGLRNMRYPALRWQPEHFLDYVAVSWKDDNGGVHTNSGIVNKAHALMVEGSVGAPVHGYEVTPLHWDKQKASDMTGHLVFSAMKAQLFTYHQSLPGYGTSLYAWCRSHPLMFSKYGLSMTTGCGTVHDALVATGLLFNTVPAPTEVRPEVVSSVRRDGWIQAYTDLHFRVRNDGTALFSDLVNVEVRTASGTTVLSPTTLMSPGLVQPHGESGDLVVPFASRILLKELPTTAVLGISPLNPGLDTDPTNNRVTFPLSAEVVPRGFNSPTYGPEDTLYVSATGNVPLVAGDLDARLLYRPDGGTKFVYGPGTPRRPADPSAILPEVDAGAIFAIGEAPLSGGWTLDVKVAGGTRKIGGKAFGVVGFDESGKLVDRDGTVITAPVVFVVFNGGSKLNATPKSNFVFCLNCVGDSFAAAIVAFSPGQQLDALFPADLVPMLQHLVPKPAAFQPPPRTTTPGWKTWIHLGPGGVDPDPIDQNPLTFNTGPM